MFCYYLLGGDTVVPSGLYARLCHVFLVCYYNAGKMPPPVFTARRERGMSWRFVCLFDCLSDVSVASRFCAKTAKHWIT